MTAAGRIQTRMALASCTPLRALLELTGRCVQSCPFCYKPASGRERELSTAEVKALLADLAALGCLTVELSGGEVLLREDLREIVAAARERAFLVQLKTNGQLLSREAARWMAELGVRQVQVSLHGADAASHDTLVGSAGAFARVQRAIRLLREASVRVKLACVVTRSNSAQVPRIMETAADWQVPISFEDRLSLPHRSGDPVEALELPEAELAAFFQCHPGITEEACASSPDPQPQQILCSAGRSLCHITEDGTLFPCSLLRIPAGNVREQPLPELWRGAPLLAWVRSFRKVDLPRCLGCEHRAFCSPCIGINHDRLGVLFEPAPHICRRARVRHVLAAARAAVSP
jgi:radical SAM protein with 4Fe4S-binding SPASM domain